MGARCHTTGRILRRLETEQKYGTYTPCESKLPPRGACVTLLLNRSRLFPLGGEITKRYRKTSKTRYCANTAGNNRYKPGVFPHPPATPEGSVSGSRRPGTPPPSTLHLSLEKFQGCSVEGRAGTKNKNINNMDTGSNRSRVDKRQAGPSQKSKPKGVARAKPTSRAT